MQGMKFLHKPLNSLCATGLKIAIWQNFLHRPLAQNCDITGAVHLLNRLQVKESTLVLRK